MIKLLKYQNIMVLIVLHHKDKWYIHKDIYVN